MCVGLSTQRLKKNISLLKAQEQGKPSEGEGGEEIKRNSCKFVNLSVSLSLFIYICRYACAKL